MINWKSRLFSLLLFFVAAAAVGKEEAPIQKSSIREKISRLITHKKQIVMSDYPQAYNPSIIDFEEGYLLTFRYHPDPLQLWISKIGVVLLDKEFNLASTPELLDTRLPHHTAPSQSEDARVFRYKKELYLIYNDNPKVINPSPMQRRDIYIAKLTYSQGTFTLEKPVKQINKEKFPTAKWQKNWVPFEWEGRLLLSYKINPHVVLHGSLTEGRYKPFYKAEKEKLAWRWGTLRGGTPALLVDGEYLALFHSAVERRSSASRNKKMWHYYMGAYTFSSKPPFNLTKMTPYPIKNDELYHYSNAPKRIIYPGSFVIDNERFHLAYGKDDREIWIATILKKKLKKVLLPIK